MKQGSVWKVHAMGEAEQEPLHRQKVSWGHGHRAYAVQLWTTGQRAAAPREWYSLALRLRIGLGGCVEPS